jgi:hypothetical protein
MGSREAKEALPYWQVNVPPALRSPTCPDFLANLSPKDVSILSTPDSHYKLLTWPEAQELIISNRIDLFQRVPSELRRYLSFNYGIKKEYGSVMEFIVSQRLQWETPIHPAGKLFECEADIKILYNDWPYGLDERILHLVVWTKFELEETVGTNDLTETARMRLEAFVEEKFRSKVGLSNVSVSLHPVV